MHLTALSGYKFVHHLFDSSLSVLRFLSKPIEDKADDLRQDQTVVESRVSVLEQQFSTFRSQSHLDFAVQQELNDWHENLASERFFVLTGLPPAPNKLSGGSYPALSLLKFFVTLLFSYLHYSLPNISPMTLMSLPDFIQFI